MSNPKVINSRIGWSPFHASTRKAPFMVGYSKFPFSRYCSATAFSSSLFRSYTFCGFRYHMPTHDNRGPYHSSQSDQAKGKLFMLHKALLPYWQIHSTAPAHSIFLALRKKAAAIAAENNIQKTMVPFGILLKCARYNLQI